MSRPSEDADTEARPLAEAIIALAETPDDTPGTDVQLKAPVQAADQVIASVSIPAFVGSGTTMAALNLYGRDAVVTGR